MVMPGPGPMNREQVFQAYGHKRLIHHVDLLAWGALLFAPAVISLFADANGLVFWVQMLLLLIVGLTEERIWHCPACEHRLSLSWDYEHCPHCKARLMPDTAPAEPEVPVGPLDQEKVLLAYAGKRFRKSVRHWLLFGALILMYL